MKAIRVSAQGVVKVEEVASIDFPYLKAAVGGWIEGVTLHRLGLRMYVNEEGLLLGLPLNVKATRLARAGGVAAMIVGDVVILGPLVGDEERGLTDDEVARLLTVLRADEL